LSSSIALETFELDSALAKEIKDDELFTDILQLARKSPIVRPNTARIFCKKLRGCRNFQKIRRRQTRSFQIGRRAGFAFRFANRRNDGGFVAESAGIARKISAENAVRLTKKAREFLEFGGSVTLAFRRARAAMFCGASDASFRRLARSFAEIAKHGNAVLISFIRSSRSFSRKFNRCGKKEETFRNCAQSFAARCEIAETDAESALAAFRSARRRCRKVSLAQFEEWVETGLRKTKFFGESAQKLFRARNRNSNELLQEAQEGLPLEKMQTVLRIYVEGLTGKEVEIAPLTAMPQESRIGDGKTIYLPRIVATNSA
jgi:hypothetical protein